MPSRLFFEIGSTPNAPASLSVSQTFDGWCYSSQGCGCLPPEARITDGQWALPLNTGCPWLVCLLILYQWLCKRCTPIIHTDEKAIHSVWESPRGPLLWVAPIRAVLWMRCRAHSALTSTWRRCTTRDVTKVQVKRKRVWRKSLPWNTSLYCVGVCIQLLTRCQISVRQANVLPSISGWKFLMSPE